MPLVAIIHIADGSDDIRESALPPGHTLVALHEFPSRLELSQGCLGCGKGKVVGWGRSKLGYVCCGTCGRRNPSVRKWFRGALFDWFGANLLGNSAPALFRTPDGYGPHADND